MAGKLFEICGIIPVVARQEMLRRGTSLVVQWLRPHASNAGGTSSIPGRGTKIPHATQQKKKKCSEELTNAFMFLPFIICFNNKVP